MTVDSEILEAGQAAVAAGQAESLSAWVNRALAERVAKEQRLSALADAITAYEAEFGMISETEIAQQARADRVAATIVRAAGRTERRPRRRRSG